MNCVRHFFSSRLNDRGISLLLLLSLFAVVTMLGSRAQKEVKLAVCRTPAIVDHAVNCEGLGQPATDLFLLFGNKININEASAADLALIPKLRKSVAQAIVEQREVLGKFSSYEEVDEVKGVGPKTLEAIKAHTTLE
jgi:competence protein ComEA